LSRRLTFAAPPSLAALYLRALLDRRPRRFPTGAGPVRIDAEVGAVRAEPARLKAYREICELPDLGQLPLTYPHILAGGVHMAMLLDRAFPVRMVGLVHLSNEIELFIPVPADETLGLDCRLQSGRTKPRGDEFRLVTEALWNGELAWRETMSFLAPAPRTLTRVPAEMPALPPALGEWAVPEDTGRRYARVSGDWNPIHLASLLARPFGFPRAIAHGMWTVARCLGRLQEGPPGPGARLQVRFLKPLLLPGHTRLHLAAPGASPEREFFLVSADGATPYLKGAWHAGEAPAGAAVARLRPGVATAS
jgi:acyl dehydratase